MEELIKDIADELNIDVPVVEWVEELDTPTKMAAADPEKNTVYLKKGLHEYDIIFALSHEMRHLWQYRYDRGMFDSYRNSSGSSNEDYNLQPAEIDANAYAYIVCCDLGFEPQLKELSQDVREKIAKRVIEMAGE